MLFDYEFYIYHFMNKICRLRTEKTAILQRPSFFFFFFAFMHGPCLILGVPDYSRPRNFALPAQNFSYRTAPDF